MLSELVSHRKKSTSVHKQINKYENARRVFWESGDGKIKTDVGLKPISESQTKINRFFIQNLLKIKGKSH